MKTRKEKQGISLIVLVITIIVMIILAATIVVSLSNSGIIGKANAAVKATNLAQMQDLATMLWADAYLDGKTGDELVAAVEEGLLKADANYKEKYFVDITDSGVTVTAKEWQIIYDKGETTTDGLVLLGNENLFNIYDDYKFTISQGETTWEYETKLIYTADNSVFYLGALQGDEAIGFSSMEDAMSKSEGFTEDTVLILGVQEIDEGELVCAIRFDGGSDEYKIVKIQRATSSRDFIKGTKIAEGVGESYQDDLRALTCETQKISDTYLLVTDYGYYEGQYMGEYTGILFLDETGLAVAMFQPENDGGGLLAFFEKHGYVELYNMGDEPNTVFENDYVAEYIDSSWVLIDVPASATIPETVEGKTITKVAIGGLIYNLNYDRDIDVRFVANLDMNGVLATVVVPSGINPSKIFEALIACGNGDIYSLDIDLTALSEVTIPEEVQQITDAAVNIYVTEEVKANYPDCEIIKTK